jgi:hypothetical protein
LAARLEKTVLSEKMIEEDLSRVEGSATKSIYKLGVGFKRYGKRVRRVLLNLFLAPTTRKKRKLSNQPKPTTHPIQSHHSIQRKNWGRKPPNRGKKFLFACFVVVLVTWMSFASGVRGLRGGALIMQETYIVMSAKNCEDFL